VPHPKGIYIWIMQCNGGVMMMAALLLARRVGLSETGPWVGSEPTRMN